jgi:hypothetical protein
MNDAFPMVLKDKGRVMSMLADTNTLTTIALLIALTAMCGLGDSLGFIHSGRVWRAGEFQWPEALKAAAAFQFGEVMYWLVLRDLAKYGVACAESQTLFWFGTTIIGVALMSGQLMRWNAADQIVAVAVLIGIAWLLYRT